MVAQPAGNLPAVRVAADALRARPAVLVAAAPIVSAIGDTITSAARLESLTKEYGCGLVVSLDTLCFAGITPPDIDVRRVEVRGRAGQLEVLAIEDPATLLLPADQ